jgi:uncharacterized repeat protein (TIGR01451 family)
MLSPMRPFPALLLAGLVCAGTAVGANDPDLPVATASGPVEVTADVERLHQARARDGTVAAEFVAAGRVRAGEELHYTLRVRNPGVAPVRDVQVTKRLPFGVRYVDGSAVGPAIKAEFSADGGNRFGPARDLRIAAPGQPERPAEPRDYTHVRWILQRPLAPGATALLRFRAHFE